MRKTKTIKDINRKGKLDGKVRNIRHTDQQNDRKRCIELEIQRNIARKIHRTKDRGRNIEEIK